MNLSSLFSKNIQGQSTKFWGIVSIIFLLSSVGLTVSLTTNLQIKQSGNISAYTPGSTNIVDMSHYIGKFGFYSPKNAYNISQNDFARLKEMMPSVFLGVDAFNQSFGESVEPELVVWWTYAEGIGGRVSFSNCNDTYYGIGNCYHPSSWQLGYGIQFSAINLLKKAFSDIHGDPNDSHLVSSVGQNVLNIDMANGVNPRCGGYSCTFPQMTIDQIMRGVSTSHETQNNWWASVLSRDPAINSYINAEALRVTRFNRQLAWGWGSYYRNHWQLYSDDLSTILTNWIALGGCAANTNCYIGPTDTPPELFTLTIPTSTPTPTPMPTLTPKPTPRPTVRPTPTPTIFPTPTPLTTYRLVIQASPTMFPSPTPTTEPTPTPEIIVFDQPIENASLSADAAIQTTTSSQLSFLVAPIAQIPPQPTIAIPTIQPVSKQYIAGQQFSNIVGIISSFGILVSTLLVFSTTRRKIFFLYQVLTQRFHKEEKINDGNMPSTEPVKEEEK